MNNNESSAPIPRPVHLRWEDLRIRLIPALLFLGAWAAVFVIWRQHGVTPYIVGQAEPIAANVSCYKAGVLAELTVSRFQRVKAGELVGHVMITQPAILAAAVAERLADIQMLQAEMKPLLAQQRNAMDYDQLQIDWMRQRAALAAAQVNLQLAEAEFRRMDALHKEQIVSQRVYEEAKAAQDRYRDEVGQLTILVGQAGTNFQALQVTNRTDLTKVTSDPLRAAIAVQEAKLKLTEAELNPLPLRAPIDGIVSTVYVRPGETVTPGQPIVAVTTLEPARIVGYLRSPLLADPKPGMAVDVLTRGMVRHVGSAKIIEVGTQFETVPAVCLGPVHFADVVLGLPINVSLPAGVKIRPGELVDLALHPTD